MQKLILLSLFLVSAQIALAQPYGDGLVINEFMAANDSLSGIADPNGQYEDWIELYNNGSTALNLESFFLSDKPDNPQKWVFPGGATIEPESYLIIWCDEDQSQPGLHANFKLSKAGEFIILSNPFGEVLDSLTFGLQQDNLAAARRPNGTGDFVIQNPTFGFNNDEVNSVFESPDARSDRLTLAPNPATTGLSIHWQTEPAPVVELIELFDYSGRLVQRQALNRGMPEEILNISLQGVLPGPCIVRLHTSEGTFSKRFLKY